MKTAALLALVLSLPATVSAAAPVTVTVDPARAAAGETVTVSGPAGAEVSLEPLAGSVAPRALGRLDARGTLETTVPAVPRGTYRVVVAGSSEAPLLEVVALGRETSLALVAFGFLFILALVVAGVVVHRRWRDAIR